MEKEHFERVRRKYGWCSSWAIWADANGKAKGNIGDLSVLDPDQNPALLNQLHTDFVLLGLNISRSVDRAPFSNFHDSRPHGQDYKLRHAVDGSRLCGAYMTDVIKGLEEVNSQTVLKRLSDEPTLVRENIDAFLKELEDVGAEDPILVPMGRASGSIVETHLGGDFEVVEIPHYAMAIAPEVYRQDVHSRLGFE